ncbi:hypothetical protein [Granulicella mallensis]|uniref:Uncharacterized protein n=1 Tax=Granulicella mallensis (strain ATCC BAA-1857 / DSM 23137 / MP5ACTX8) TaxID=682795 RepID=G8NWL8_GRAMM|nr:hypothetical protein [Granulicella mallensis]AEU38905.1 hypothetical protein AciX8_4635 [Granulicella mallensis MP5ACTX8]
MEKLLKLRACPQTILGAKLSYAHSLLSRASEGHGFNRADNETVP